MCCCRGCGVADRLEPILRTRSFTSGELRPLDPKQVSLQQKLKQQVSMLPGFRPQDLARTAQLVGTRYNQGCPNTGRPGPGVYEGFQRLCCAELCCFRGFEALLCTAVSGLCTALVFKRFLNSLDSVGVGEVLRGLWFIVIQVWLIAISDQMGCVLPLIVTVCVDASVWTGAGDPVKSELKYTIGQVLSALPPLAVHLAS